MVNRVSVVFRTRPISNMDNCSNCSKRKQILFKRVQKYLSFLKNEKKRKIGEIKVNCEEKIKKNKARENHRIRSISKTAKRRISRK